MLHRCIQKLGQNRLDEKNKFFNKDISLDIFRKSIRILTVILKSSMEGSMSHSFDVCLGFFMLCRRKVNIIFHNLFIFT